MTLEKTIAECNAYFEPLKEFIERKLGPDLLGAINEENSMFAYQCTRDPQNFMIGIACAGLLINHAYDWLDRETNRPLHPVVKSVMETKVDCNWYDIMLEWPHVSQDGERLAYTRNAIAGVQDRRTVTSIGKYLARHFPGVPANILRDAAALHTPDKFEMWTTTEDIVRAVQEGPTSCMKWPGHTDTGTHPYSCYAPELGWTIAVRVTGTGSIDGRCLCHKHPKTDALSFVRSFTRCKVNPETGYSNSDTALEAWLKTQGYEHRNEWPHRTRLDTKDNQLFPYIDGYIQRVNYDGHIDEDGEHECDNTDGTSSGSGELCSDCNNRCSSDDMYSIGVDNDCEVCENCIEYYSTVRGRNGREYYTHDANAVYVNGRYYHDKYLSDNNIVELANGDYAELDDTVCVDGDYYLSDDSDVCYYGEDYHLISDSDTVNLDEAKPGTGEMYAHVDDAWECAETGNTYHDDTPSVIIDGEKYHTESAAANKQMELELEHHE